jgi:hypothetical protein
MFANTASEICNHILRFSHTAECISAQTDIAYTQAQCIGKAVKKIHPSQKDLQRIVKQNVAGVMSGENISKGVHFCTKMDIGKQAKSCSTQAPLLRGL